MIARMPYAAYNLLEILTLPAPQFQRLYEQFMECILKGNFNKYENKNIYVYPVGKSSQ